MLLSATAVALKALLAGIILKYLIDLSAYAFHCFVRSSVAELTRILIEEVLFTRYQGYSAQS